jgi:hypothetical protein
MQFVLTFHMYIVTWLTCHNICIYQGILEYFFHMVASWNMLRNIQSMSSEHVQEYSLESFMK